MTTDQGTATTATPAAVTLDEVRHVAALASLELTSEEELRLERDLNAILGYVAELSELDTSAVEPMAQVSELGQPATGVSLADSDALRAALRADELRPSLARATVMAEAPATDGTFFKVPKVIER